MSETSRSENAYFRELLRLTKKVVFDADGANCFPSYLEYAKLLENNAILDSFDNFDVVAQHLSQHVGERFTQAEREKFDFDAFSVLEFAKVRHKFINFLYTLSFASEIYRQQAQVCGEDFRLRLEAQADQTQPVQPQAQAQ